MAKPFYLTIIQDMAGMMAGRGQHRLDVDRVVRRFEEAGGSWYKLAHGSPEALARLREASLEALRYESKQEAEDE